MRADPVPTAPAPVSVVTPFTWARLVERLVAETVTVAADAARLTLRLLVLAGVSTRLTRVRPCVSSETQSDLAVVYVGCAVVTQPKASDPLRPDVVAS